MEKTMEKKSRLRLAGWNLEDDICRLAEQVTKNFLLGLRESDPGILDVFYDRDVVPYREIMPWSGEYAGKYITGAYYIYQITGDPALADYIQTFLEELMSLIAEDGYLGCFQKECHLTGATSDRPGEPGVTWDAWAHYHIMYGMFLWYQETGRKEYLDAVKRMAELFLRRFYRQPDGEGPQEREMRLYEIGYTDVNFSPLHIFALLYQETGDQRYLDFAEEVIKDLEAEGAGDYIRYTEQGLGFYQCPKPRWESLHTIIGIARLYQCTGNKRYLDAAVRIFYSTLKTDVHNTGGFSTREQAVGNPYQDGAIEICCVVAYNAFACEILKLTGDVRIADFLEISLYNAVAGSFALNGRWSTYDTPMDGEKWGNTHYNNFQARPGGPDLNCCSVNAPRALGNLAEWAYMEDETTVYLHYFGKGRLVTEDGMELEIEGEYPISPVVKLILHKMPEVPGNGAGTIFAGENAAGAEEAAVPGNGAGKRLAVRIPVWSKKTEIIRQGKGKEPQQVSAAAGGYWYWENPQAGDVVEMKWDFSLHLLSGELDRAGKSCVYRGPLLFGLDASLNPGLNLDELPVIEKETLKDARMERLPEKGRFPGYLLMKLTKGIVLTDFRHLGMTGCRYRTWLPFV